MSIENSEKSMKFFINSGPDFAIYRFIIHHGFLEQPGNTLVNIRRPHMLIYDTFCLYTSHFEKGKKSSRK